MRQIFQKGLLNRHVFSRRVYLFVEQTLLSHRTDTNLPRNPFLVLEHIHIFQELLFSHGTGINFPGTYLLLLLLLLIDIYTVYIQNPSEKYFLLSMDDLLT